MSQERIALTFPAHAEYLLLARLALAGIARATPIDDEVLADLKLAVTEACGNAVKHAYVNGEGVVKVEFTLANDEIAITVEDHGVGIARTDVSGPLPVAAEDIADHGMGLALIRSIADETLLVPGKAGHGLIVHIRKRLTQPAEV